ncbi:MAG: hypothetical protein MHMPM18_000326 [Marteilia pararefringens]
MKGPPILSKHPTMWGPKHLNAILTRPKEELEDIKPDGNVINRHRFRYPLEEMQVDEKHIEDLAVRLKDAYKEMEPDVIDQVFANEKGEVEYETDTGDYDVFNSKFEFTDNTHVYNIKSSGHSTRGFKLCFALNKAYRV